jgi:hypothetical protein
MAAAQVKRQARDFLDFTDIYWPRRVGRVHTLSKAGE